MPLLSRERSTAERGRLALAVVFVICVLATVAWFATQGAAPTSAIDGRAAANPQARESLTPIDERPAAGENARAALAVAEPATKEQRIAAPVQEARVTRPVGVRVLDEAGAPQIGFAVWITDPQTTSTLPVDDWPRTDESGRCTLDVRDWTAGEMRVVQARDPEGVVRFLAPCPLEPEMLVVRRRSRASSAMSCCTLSARRIPSKGSCSTVPGSL